MPPYALTLYFIQFDLNDLYLSSINKLEKGGEGKDMGGGVEVWGSSTPDGVGVMFHTRTARVTGGWNGQREDAQGCHGPSALMHPLL